MPCNPMWGVKTPSKLHIELSGPANAGVTGSMEISSPAGSLQMRPLSRSDFPLDIDIDRGTSCGVMVALDFAGEETSVTVTSRVTGTSSRGPDVCTLNVAEGNEHEETNVTVAAEG